MGSSRLKSTVLLSVFLATSFALAQDQQEIAAPAATLTTKSIKAVGYPVGSSVKVIFVGTSVAPNASGEAKVGAKTSVTNIEVRVQGLPQPTTLGAEFLTYVVWGISPDGRTTNLGELQIDKNGEDKLNETTPLQTFAMIVTAEPYAVVRRPSEVVVLENDTKKNAKVKIFPNCDFQLMVRGQYAKLGNPLALMPDLKTTPLEVYEARNAVDIAKSHQAEKYAPEVFSKAQSSLQMMENSITSQANKKQIVSNARQTMSFAEDARALSVQRQDQERIAKEKQAAADAAAAKAKAEADAEAKRQAELNAAKQAQMKAEADAAAVKAKAEADAAAAKAKAEADALAANAAAARADAERAQQAAAALRAQLLQQLNSVLETTDSPRGLIVNMADVLFAFGKYNLQPDTQVKLAKLSGIILSHPGLNLAIEGYTDNIGSDEGNLKLSQQRADAVRDFLVQQGLAANTVTSVGLGKTNPVADNSTAAGRQKNRRVEIIVSGEVIGQKIGK